MKPTAGAFSLDRRGLAIGVLFLGVAAVLALTADASFGFGLDQTSYNVVTEELLEAWQQGEPLENEFGSPYRQSFALFHAASQHFLGDPESSYRLLLFLSAGAYLLAMYVLLAHILDHRAIAALTAVLSIVQRYTLGTSFWGMGEFQAILPRVVVLAVFPLAWLLFERHLNSRRVLEAFVIVALGFALHLSAVYFYCILLLTYGLHLLLSRDWSAALNVAVATGFFLFALKAIPSPMWSHTAEQAGLWIVPLILLVFGLLLCFSRYGHRRWMSVVAVLCLGTGLVWLVGSSSLQSLVGISVSEPTDQADQLEALNRALYARFGWSLFPISLGTLGFALFNGALLGAVALYEFVRRWRLGATQRERIVGLFVVSTLVVSLGITGALQLYCRITGRPDMILELFRALRFIYLPMYIYLGLFLQHRWQQDKFGGIKGRLLLATLMGALLLPPRQVLAHLPDSTKLFVRNTVEKSNLLHAGDPSQSRYLQLLLATKAEKEQARSRYRDFTELCTWIQRSTPEESVLLTTDYAFTYHCDRSIMISYQQGAGGARSMSVEQGHVAWHEAYTTIAGALESRSPERIEAAAAKYEVDYIVTSAAQPSLSTPAVFTNPSYSLYPATR
ncbi:MAG: hypothetical protein AAF657_21690 [Acidobacteriota bacterium]